MCCFKWFKKIIKKVKKGVAKEEGKSYIRCRFGRVRAFPDLSETISRQWVHHRSFRLGDVFVWFWVKFFCWMFIKELKKRSIL